MPFRLEHQKRKDNVIANVLIRRKDITEKLKSWTIFLQVMNIKKTKEQDYHPFMEISKVKNQNNSRWKYWNKLIVEQKKKKKKIMKQNHNNPWTEHSGFKKILQKMKYIQIYTEMSQISTEEKKQKTRIEKRNKTIKRNMKTSLYRLYHQTFTNER